jgi:hypothetical protein
MYKLIIKHDMSTWHMKVRVIRVFRVPDCDTRITQKKFGFCKLLPKIPEQNSGFGYFGFGLRVFCPAYVCMYVCFNDSVGREFINK